MVSVEVAEEYEATVLHSCNLHALLPALMFSSRKRGVHMKRRGVIFVIAFLLASCAAITSQKRATVPIDVSPQQGPASAPITVVEFIDYT
jgi:predicted permease